MSISKLLPAGPIANPEHADALLEIAFLMTAVDGRLEEEELAAFREFATRVYGKDRDPNEIVKHLARPDLSRSSTLLADAT